MAYKWQEPLLFLRISEITRYEKEQWHVEGVYVEVKCLPETNVPHHHQQYAEPTIDVKM